MQFGNLENLVLGCDLERKLRHWKKRAMSGYFPRRKAKYYRKGADYVAARKHTI